MRLKSLPVRGTTEPILLLLIDSATDFTHDVVSPIEWDSIVQKGDAKPPDYPFGTLPLITFGHGARGGNDTTISEPSAILFFLEAKLAPIGSATRAPDAQGRLEMLRSASSHLLTQLLTLMTTSPDWLSPPHRDPLKIICETYLASLSYHLSSSFFPPLLSPPLPEGQPGTSLTAAVATAATLVALIEDIFPVTLGCQESDASEDESGMRKRWPRVEEMRRGVEDRERVKAWRSRHSDPSTKGSDPAANAANWEWSEGEWATRKFMREQAEKWDQ
ncbi:hypothetical protein T439DRAFT_325196 [Meredithblackwellia eburnea MCA 4105]